MELIESAINYLVECEYLPKKLAGNAFQIAKVFAKTKGESEVAWKLSELSLSRPKNPLGFLTGALRRLPNREREKCLWELDGKEYDRLIEIARTKWIDEDD